jgi:hypothetical protein
MHRTEGAGAQGAEWEGEGDSSSIPTFFRLIAARKGNSFAFSAFSFFAVRDACMQNAHNVRTYSEKCGKLRKNYGNAFNSFCGCMRICPK